MSSASNGTPDKQRHRSHIGERIRELRLNRGFSQTGMAEDLGIAHSTLSAWERGTRAMNIDALFSLAEYFNIKIEDLVNHQSETPIKQEQN